MSAPFSCLWCGVVMSGSTAQGRVCAEYGHGLEREPEVADAREQPVQLRLVGELADELRGAAAPHERHAVERCGEALAEVLAHRDPNSQGRFHDDLRIRVGCVRAHHAGASSPRVIDVVDLAELESAARRVNESEVRRAGG